MQHFQLNRGRISITDTRDKTERVDICLIKQRVVVPVFQMKYIQQGKLYSLECLLSTK